MKRNKISKAAKIKGNGCRTKIYIKKGSKNHDQYNSNNNNYNIQPFLCLLTSFNLNCIKSCSVSYTQVRDTYNGWVDRPFDDLTTRIPKQNVPFPSVTICPSGVT